MLLYRGAILAAGSAFSDHWGTGNRDPGGDGSDAGDQGYERPGKWYQIYIKENLAVCGDPFGIRPESTGDSSDGKTVFADYSLNDCHIFDYCLRFA